MPEDTDLGTLRVYVSGPLTGLPEEDAVPLKAFYGEISGKCEAKKYKAYVPHLSGTDPGTDPEVDARTVNAKDLEEVARSNLVIALVTPYSVGVGMEIQQAAACGVDVILLEKKPMLVSRMAQGTPVLFERISYNTTEEALSELDAALDRWAESVRSSGRSGTLSDRDILHEVGRGELLIVNPDGSSAFERRNGNWCEISPGQLDANGYELRANCVYSSREASCVELGPSLENPGGTSYVIRKGESVIIESFERLALSPRLSATVNSLAHLSLIGLYHTATSIHPGWGFRSPDGPRELLVALCNVGDMKIPISYKEPFCRLLFSRCATPASIRAPEPTRVFGRLYEHIREKRRAALRRRKWTRAAAIPAMILALTATGLLARFEPKFVAVPVSVLALGVAVLKDWLGAIGRWAEGSGDRSR